MTRRVVYWLPGLTKAATSLFALLSTASPPSVLNHRAYQQIDSENCPLIRRPARRGHGCTSSATRKPRSHRVPLGHEASEQSRPKKLGITVFSSAWLFRHPKAGTHCIVYSFTYCLPLHHLSLCVRRTS